MDYRNISTSWKRSLSISQKTIEIILPLGMAHVLRIAGKWYAIEYIYIYEMCGYLLVDMYLYFYIMSI